MSKQYKINNFFSFSGGVESTTMGILYGKGATAVWVDTGAEHKEMYERIDYCEKRLKEIHGGDFELIRLKPSVNCNGKKIDNLTDCIYEKGYMPSKLKRFCTPLFKIEPIDNYLALQAKPFTASIEAKYERLKDSARKKKKSIIRKLEGRKRREIARIKCNKLMIGFNAEEEPGKDRTGNYMKNPNTVYSYPLYEDGYTREDCEDILRMYDLHPSMPIYMQRGGCKFCIFKTVKEYKALYYFDKETFEKNRVLEESIQDKRKKFFAMSMSGQSFAEIAATCEREKQMFSEGEMKQMYQKVKPSQSCGAFCHR